MALFFSCLLNFHFDYLREGNQISPLTFLLFLVLDKYADLSPQIKQEWKTHILSYASFFVGIVAYCTYHCGMGTLLQLMIVPACAIVHGRPLVPYWSFTEGRLRLVKLKDLLGVIKPLFGATLIGVMDTQAIMSYVTNPAKSESRKSLALAYAILYDFLWENTADVRDYEEDCSAGITTLAVRLGPKRTLISVAIVVALSDLYLTSLIGAKLQGSVLLGYLARATLFPGFFSYLALTKPRGNAFWWGFGTLVGLTPALWAQSGLI